MKFIIRRMETNLASNITNVTVEIIEQLGPISRIKDVVSFDLEGKYLERNQEVEEKISEFLTQHGLL